MYPVTLFSGSLTYHMNRPDVFRWNHFSPCQPAVRLNNESGYLPSPYGVSFLKPMSFQGHFMKTQDVLKTFEEMTKITRPSGYNKEISNYLVQKLKDLGFLVYQVPEGFEGAYNIYAHNQHVVPEKKNAIILQGHMDIVSTAKDGNHLKPIELVVEGDYLKTKNERTLGADNGLGLAYILQIAEKFKELPLQILFTIDEEIGLLGAKVVPANIFMGKKLINLDTGGLGKIIVGCPGVNIFEKSAQVPRIPLNILGNPHEYKRLLIDISSATGGHSGLDIHRGRFHPIRSLMELLMPLHDKIYLQRVQGGHVHNSIPTQAQAEFFVHEKYISAVYEELRTKLEFFKQHHVLTDPRLQMALKVIDPEGSGTDFIVSREFQEKFLTILGRQFKQGVISVRPDGITPKTSQNLGMIHLQDGHLKLALNMRSIDAQDSSHHLMDTKQQLSELLRKDVKPDIVLPVWESKDVNQLAKLAEESYQAIGIKPKVEIASGTVEPALFTEKVPEQISVRADIYDQHAITERIYLPSLEPFSQFLKTLLLKLAKVSD